MRSYVAGGLEQPPVIALASVSRERGKMNQDEASIS